MFCSRLRTCVQIYVRTSRFLSSTITQINVANHEKADTKPFTENSYSYHVLKRLEKYNLKSAREMIKVENDVKVNVEETRWKILSEDELCRLFAHVSLEAAAEEIDIAESRYDDMCSAIAERCNDLKDHQLKSILASLCQWRSHSTLRNSNFSKISDAVDVVLDSRYRKFNPNTILEFINLWTQLGLLRQSNFVYHSINRLSGSPGRLIPQQVILVLYYLNVIRTIRLKEDMFKIEQRLLKVFDELTLEEIGIACVGYFKTQHVIHLDELKNLIISKLLENIDTVHEITLVSIIKAFRYKIPPRHYHRLEELIEGLLPQIDRLSITSVAHIPVLLNPAQYFHEDVLEASSEKLIKNIEEARLKDIETILFSLTLFHFIPRKSSQCIFQTVISELKRPERDVECKTFPKSFVAVVHHVAMMGFHDDHLINMVLDMNFIRTTYGKSKYIISREILSLDTIVELEHSSYTGNRLPVDARNYLSRRYSAFLPNPEIKLNFHQSFEYDIIQTTNRISMKQSVSKFTLPNQPNADIIVVVDAKGNFHPIPDDFANIPDYTGIIRPPADNYMALVPVSRNMYIRNADGALKGDTLVKIKHLNILGYTPLIIRQDEWPNDGSDSDKEDYLNNLINKKITQS